MPQSPGQLWYKSLPHQRKEEQREGLKFLSAEEIQPLHLFLSTEEEESLASRSLCLPTNRLSPNTPGINPSKNTKDGRPLSNTGVRSTQPQHGRKIQLDITQYCFYIENNHILMDPQFKLVLFKGQGHFLKNYFSFVYFWMHWIFTALCGEQGLHSSCVEAASLVAEHML